jgi:glycerol kinase
MVVNEMLMQFQSDMLDVPVVCPAMIETTALGAAYAAGLAVGYWQDLNDLKQNWGIAHTWNPDMPSEQREKLYHYWKKAVTRSFEWEE